MTIREGKGKSVIAFPDEYVVVDIETTGLDFEYDDIIEVSGVKVKDDKITNEFSSLVRPNNFSSLPDEIIDLTGITDEMILSAPSFSEVIPRFLDFIGESIIIGHNVHFDVTFLFDAAKKFDILLSNDIIDTFRISRKLYPDLEHHRLIDIVKKLGVTQDVHHRALADVRTTFECYVKMKHEIIDTYGIDSFVADFHRRHSPSYEDYINGMHVTVSEIDDSNPLFGKIIVFTGELSSMGRKDAFQIVLNLGGIPSNSVTKKTSFLVVGNEEFCESVKNGKTKKMEKADAYAKKGLDIVTISEDTFFGMIQDYVQYYSMKFGGCRIVQAWPDWDYSIHSDTDQERRQVRAASYTSPFVLDKETRTARFISSVSASQCYNTSLSQCDCLDFQRRHLPCKHIYRLAMELGLIEIFKRK